MQIANVTFIDQKTGKLCKTFEMFWFVEFDNGGNGFVDFIVTTYQHFYTWFNTWLEFIIFLVMYWYSYKQHLSPFCKLLHFEFSILDTQLQIWEVSSCLLSLTSCTQSTNYAWIRTIMRKSCLCFYSLG